MGKLKNDEKELLDSVEAGEWQSVPEREKELKRYQEYAAATFKKDRRINIRISSKDLKAPRSALFERASRTRPSLPAYSTSMFPGSSVKPMPNPSRKWTNIVPGLVRPLNPDRWLAMDEAIRPVESDE